MIDEILRSAQLDLLTAAYMQQDEKARRRLTESFWDIQYLIRFGVITPPPQIHFEPRPLPDPSPMLSHRLAVAEGAVAALIDVIAGDPDPQPSRNPLKDRETRLFAAQNLAERLKAAIPLVENEINRLG